MPATAPPLQHARLHTLSLPFPPLPTPFLRPPLRMAPPPLPSSQATLEDGTPYMYQATVTTVKGVLT